MSGTKAEALNIWKISKGMSGIRVVSNEALR
jgi:hypothetical protein